MPAWTFGIILNLKAEKKIEFSWLTVIIICFNIGMDKPFMVVDLDKYFIILFIIM